MQDEGMDPRCHSPEETLQPGLKKQVASSLHPQLRVLSVGNNFNQPLDLSNQDELMHLFLGHRFNQPLSNLSQCTNLSLLEIGDDFDQPLDIVDTSSNNLRDCPLRSLRLGNAFNHPLQLSHHTYIYAVLHSAIPLTNL